MAASRPNVARIALERAFEPSMMKRRGTVGLRPRSTRLSINACTVAAFSVAPSTSPSGCLSPFTSTPIAATRVIGRRHVTFGQAHRTFELARRDVDQHLVHGPFTEPVFRHRPFPTGKGLLLAVEATKPRTRDLHLAAVETDLALRLAPAMRRPILATPMARTARRSRIDLHHLAKRLKPSGQAKPLEARRHARQRFDLQLSRGNCSGCDKSVHGVAFLSWNQHPEPTGSRRATPLLLFQQ